MLIIGVDYHPSMQQIAWVGTETGECGERRLAHCAEAEQFYRERTASTPVSTKREGFPTPLLRERAK